MLIMSAASATLLIALTITARAVRRLEAELAILRARTDKLVRLSVAVDDLRHEAAHVVPAYRDAATRVKAIRRPGQGEAPR
jgi:hypothetical protein